ncbi:MAG: protein phosphatase 2C domain-containing protein [Zoogloeaceae bacterium]|jgi:protein phosphatase|nr:protein phosphatase 2C domain-containing protein [Zoogloeaceae bacterium]
MRKLGKALEMLAVTDTGLLRENNEDAVSVHPDKGIVLLADGMGGCNAGEVASNMAVALLSRKLDRVNLTRLEPEKALQTITKGIEATNAVIYQTSIDQLKYAGMGTTLVVGCFANNRLYVAHLGDSRAYRLHAGQLKRLTRDHTPMQDMIDAGLITEEIAHRSYGKHLINRAMGISAQASPECHVHDVAVGDLYLFCSDGLTDMVDDAEIAAILQTPDCRLFEIGERLMRQANGNGGLDNISLILVRVIAPFPT